MRRRLATALVALALPTGCGLVPSQRDELGRPPSTAVAVETPEGAPTWAEDVAPILFESCAACHHADGIAPFPLLSHDDARKRARQIALVTEDRYMPPWPPAPGEHAFVGERGLSRAEIETLRRWHEAGAPEGDPARAPPPPEVPTGWMLGEPDLVVRMPEAFTVPAEGLDVFRNFVIPVPEGERRWVRALELRPGNPRVVHHAIVQVDPERLCRRLDARDALPGFPGMELGDSRPPDGHFIGWTPGRVPVPLPGDLAWPLEPGTDLVLQLHLVPTGKPEPVQAEIGLHFADGPPERRPYVLLLRDDDIDIPPGEADYLVEDEFELPVPVEVLGLYPHAHYLGKDLRALAELPDGTLDTLLRIPDWDFNWQDEYRFVEPVELPAGTVLRMRHVYDNSEENLRNPFHPPRRVRFGQQSTDEMATLTVQVLTATENERDVLEETWLRRGIARFDDPWAAHHTLADLLRRTGRLDEAIEQYRASLAVNPGNARAHHDLGTALAERGELEAALASLEAATRADPQLAASHHARASLLRELDRPREAVAAWRAAIAADASFAPAHRDLARAMAAAGLAAQALPHLEAVARLQPDSAEARHELAGALAAAGRVDEALAREREAMELRPDWAEPLAGAARLLALHPDAVRRRPAEAVRLAERAVRSEGGEAPLVLDALATALASAGLLPEAAQAAERALEAARVTGNAALVAHLERRAVQARQAAAR